MNEIDFAKGQWMCEKLRKEDIHTAMILIAMMEINILKGSGKINTSNSTHSYKI